MRIDLNADLGEGFGPWRMGDDAAMLDLVNSANIACGGHASDPETMYTALKLAAAKGVAVGAHPGFNDREGFGRRVIPMPAEEIGRMVAAQIGALMAVARLVPVTVRYVKPHGALGNLAARDIDVARAIAAAVRQIDDRLVAFETEIKRCPEVVDCWLMTGSFDYLLRVAVGDLAEFERFLTGRLTKLPGVASLESSIPIRRVKYLPARLD